MCGLSEDTFIGSASIIENGAFAVFFYQISLQRWCYNNLLYSFFFKKAEKVDSYKAPTLWLVKVAKYRKTL